MSVPCRVKFYQGDQLVYDGAGNLGMMARPGMYQFAMNMAIGEWEWASKHHGDKLEDRGFKTFGTEWDTVVIAGKKFQFIEYNGERTLASEEKIAELAAKKEDQE